VELELHETIEKAKHLYEREATIWCPYFSAPVTLNADGFNHLQYKANRQPRIVAEQLLKLRLLKKALLIIRKAGTLQEYRRLVETVGKRNRDGFFKTKEVEYWGFHAIVGSEKQIKIVVVIRRVGDGKIIFWSVLPHRKFNQQKLYTEGIEDD